MDRKGFFGAALAGAVGLVLAVKSAAAIRDEEIPAEKAWMPKPVGGRPVSGQVDYEITVNSITGRRAIHVPRSAKGPGFDQLLPGDVVYHSPAALPDAE